MRERIISSIVVIIVLLVVFLAGSGITYYLINKNPNEVKKNDELYTTGVIKCSNDIKIDETGISTSVGKIYDATVTIQNYRNTKLYGTGSGFVYKKDDKYGYILTNHHVVEGASELIITLSNDKQVYGEVLGSDAYLDLAVVKIDSSVIKQVATLGNSELSNVGDTIFTVGTPLGYNYRGTVTKGTISGKNRLVTVSVNQNSDFVMNVIQIDAAINPGNSGGPLLNINGEVIGINSMKLIVDEVEGMGFAIPIEYAMKYVDKLENGEEIERPLIGINMINVADKIALYQNRISLDKSIEYGVVVSGIVSGSGADKGGLKTGDVILEIDGTKITNAAYLKYILYKHNIDDTVEIKINRNGKEETLKIILTKVEK